MLLLPCGLAAASLVLPVPQDLAALAGHWEGTLEKIGLEFDIDLERDQAGTWSGDISIPVQSLKDRALVDFAEADGGLRFTIEGIPGSPTFQARFAEGPDRVTGDFTQGGGELEFSMRRAGTEPVLGEAELEELRAWIDRTRTAWHVPGLGVAIVSTDEVILAEGFGLREAGGADAADADTLFAIGSCTKAFTTLALAREVEAGNLAWEDKAIDRLDGLGFHDPRAHAEMTLRDLVTHRSGLPRHDLMWYGREGRGIDELVAGMAHLEFNEELRSIFQYNNLGFVMAAEILRQATGQGWHERVAAEVLAPLGMERSCTTKAAFLADGNRATGHEADREDDGSVTVRTLPVRNIDLVGAAGSIDSTANDMARWARVQLGQGEIDGTRLVREDTLRALHTPRVAIPNLPSDPMLGIGSLGMGWFVDGYRGHLRVQHGGNIDGFSAMVALFPSDDLAVVVLANQNASPVPEFVVRRVLEVASGLEPRDWSGEALARIEASTSTDDGESRDEDNEQEDLRVADAPHAHRLDAYVGRYEHPGYGILEIAAAEASEGPLRVTLGSLEVDLEHWHFETFKGLDAKEGKSSPLAGLLLRFETSSAGDIVAVHAPLESSVAPIRFEVAPIQVAAVDLAAFEGQYRVRSLVLTVALEGDTLRVSVPGQPTTTLSPRKDDLFIVEELEGFSLKFRRGDDGAVAAVELRQPQGNFLAERVDD